MPRRLVVAALALAAVLGAAVPLVAPELLAPGRFSLRSETAPPRPPCVWRVAIDPALLGPAIEALDQFTGLTGIGWTLTAPQDANLTLRLADPGPPNAIAVARVSLANDRSAIRVADIALRPSWGHTEASPRILVHELAHAVGLGHSDDPTSLLAPTWDRHSVLRSDDLDALAAAGRRCYP